MRYGKFFTPVALCAILSACAHTSTDLATNAAPINWTAERGKKVVLVDPDVELNELTFGGVAELRADWTRTGKGFIKADVASTLRAKGVATVSADDITDPHEVQLVKLHGAVGQNIMQNSIVQLPTKKNNFDWTLGTGAAVLRDHYQADYALFVYVRDSYSSGSRMAFHILTMSASGAMQTGFASLVDLRTGRVVWFNRLISSTGSLKEEKPAAESVKNLLDGLPL